MLRRKFKVIFRLRQVRQLLSNGLPWLDMLNVDKSILAWLVAVSISTGRTTGTNFGFNRSSISPSRCGLIGPVPDALVFGYTGLNKIRMLRAHLYHPRQYQYVKKHQRTRGTSTVLLVPVVLQWFKPTLQSQVLTNVLHAM